MQAFFLSGYLNILLFYFSLKLFISFLNSSLNTSITSSIFVFPLSYSDMLKLFSNLLTLFSFLPTSLVSSRCFPSLPYLPSYSPFLLSFLGSFIAFYNRNLLSIRFVFTSISTSYFSASSPLLIIILLQIDFTH